MDNPILAEAKKQDAEYYAPFIAGFAGHAIGVYYGSKHNFSLVALIAIAAGCGLGGVLIGKAAMKLFINK